MLNKASALLLTLSISLTHALAQTQATTFTLQGTINARDSGHILLTTVNTEDYYPCYHGTKQALVLNGKFSITDSIRYPEYYMLFLKYDSGWVYLSNPFFVSPGNNTIHCDSSKTWEDPAIINDPGPYAALWKLVRSFASGYEPRYDSLYNQLSPTVRNTYTGRILGQKLATARTACIGCRFPNLSLAGIDDLSRKIPIQKTHPKYTLIDLWFSHCDACMDQFPRYKELYTRFHPASFEIIAISTDEKKTDIALWKKIVSEKALPWPQFLDNQGMMINQFAILKFPSNFLLDEKGMVIRKNIEPKELDAFLNDHLTAR